MFTFEESYTPDDIFTAYIYGNGVFSYDKNKVSAVPFVFVSPFSRDIIPEEILLAGIKIYIDLVSAVFNGNKEKLNKKIEDRKKLLNLISIIHKKVTFKDKKPDYSQLSKEEKDEFNYFKDIGKDFRKKKTFKRLKSKDYLGESKETLVLDKQGINIYSLKRVTDKYPDIVFLGFLSDLIDNSNFEKKLDYLKHFFDKRLHEYIVNNINTSLLIYKSFQYLLNHSLPLKEIYIGNVGGQKLYGVTAKNIKKNYSETEIKEKFIERLSKDFLEGENINENEDFINKLFEDYFLKIYNLTVDYHRNSYPRVVNEFTKFYKENYSKEPPDFIIYEKFKVKEEKDFDIKDITLTLDNYFQGYLYVAENREEKDFLKNNLENFINKLKTIEHRKNTYNTYEILGGLLEKTKTDKLNFLKWEYLLAYYDNYKTNEKFEEFISNPENSIKFIYDIFFASILIYIIALKANKKRIPLFLINVEENETLSFFDVFNSYLYLISEFPFQSLRKSTLLNKTEKGISALAKNYLLSLLKNNKTLTFRLNEKEISLHKKEGIILVEEASNNVFPYYLDENAPEIKRKHRLLHVYQFKYEAGEVSIKYIGNLVKLAEQKIEGNINLNINKNHYVIAVCEKLSKEDIESIINELLPFDIEKNKFNYVKVFRDFPIIRRKKIYRKSNNKRQKTRDTEGYFLYREDAGKLKDFINKFLGDKEEIGKAFAIIYTQPSTIKDLNFNTTYSTLYLIYHNEELSKVIEKILFSLNIYSSESYFISYSKPKRILPMNDKLPLKRNGQDFYVYISVLLLEMLFMFRRLINGREEAS